MVLVGVYHLAGGPLLVAYESAWAISTSEHADECTPDEATDLHGLVRSVVVADGLGAGLAGRTTRCCMAAALPHADAHFTQPNIEGGLVDAASQDLTSFQALIDAAIATYQRPQPGAGH